MTLEKVSYLGVPAVTQETQFLYKRIDGLLSSTETEVEFDETIFVNFIKHMMNNRLSDAVLYSRLSSRCISFADQFEEMYPENDFSEIGQEYLEHSREEIDNHNSLMILAQELGFACSLDFELKDTANTKFSDPQEFLDFTQWREMMSIAEFYTLYRILVETDILDDLDDETQFDVIQNIKESLEVEIEHFEEFFDYSAIGADKFIEMVSEVKDKISEGF